MNAKMHLDGTIEQLPQIRSEDMSDNFIKIWKFYEAPNELQKLSQNGGDEDWIALVPKSWGYPPQWLEEGSSFGCCCVEEHELETGDTVYIGCHS